MNSLFEQASNILSRPVASVTSVSGFSRSFDGPCLVVDTTGAKHIVHMNNGTVYKTPTDLEETKTFVHPKGFNREASLIDALAEAVEAPHGTIDIKDTKTIDVEGKDSYDLVLVHYHKVPGRVTPAPLGASHVRGSVVDQRTGTVVSASQFGHTPVAVSDTITDELRDNDGNLHVFGPATIWKKCFEGVALEVFFHGGEIWVRTGAKLDATKSHFADSGMFRALYDQAGGPQAADLYDTSKLHSPWQYSFLLVAPGLCLGSRTPVTVPHLVLLEITKMWSTDPTYCPYDESEVDMSGPRDPSMGPIPDRVTVSGVYSPKSMTRHEASNMLSHGHCEDAPRVTQGEPIIAYTRDISGRISDIVKIYPGGYNHRISLIGTGNFKEAFFVGLDHVRNLTDNEFLSMYKHYAYLTKERLSAMLEAGPIDTLPTVKRSGRLDRGTRMSILWLNILVSVPPHSQRAALTLIDDYVSAKDNLATWMATEGHQIDFIGAKASENKKRYGNALSNFFVRYHKYKTNSARTHTVAKAVTDMLSRESGLSIYRCTNALRKHLQGEAYRAAKAAQSSSE